MQLRNPILDRELIEHLRSPRAFAIQAIYVAVLSAVLLVAWKDPDELGLDAARSLRLYDTFSLGQLVLLALLAPILSAPAVAGERERGTFDLLLTTPLKPSTIVTGKLLGAVVYVVLLSLSALPLYAMCMVLGGVGHREVIATYVVLLSAAVLCGAGGLAASVFLERSRNALAVCYVVTLPLVMILVLLNPLRSVPAAAAIALVALGLTATALVLVARRLSRPFDTAPTAAEEEERDAQLGLTLNQRRFPDNLLFPGGTGMPLDETANPVYEKELRYELFGRGTLLLRLLLQASLLAALPFFVAALLTGAHWVYCFYILIFVMLLGPSLAAGVFTQERERGTLDLLTTTALPRNTIIRAKLFVSLRHIAVLSGFLLSLLPLLWALYLFLGRGYALRGGSGFHHFTRYLPLDWVRLMAGSVAVLAATLVLVVMVTCLFSLVCRTTLRSMVASYLVLAGLFLAPFAAYMILTRLSGVPPESLRWLCVTSPFFTLAALEIPAGETGTQLPLLGQRFAPDIASFQLAAFLLFALLFSAAAAAAIRGLYDRYCRFRHERGL